MSRAPEHFDEFDTKWNELVTRMAELTKYMEENPDMPQSIQEEVIHELGELVTAMKKLLGV